jgi:replicative DNA helicase
MIINKMNEWYTLFYIDNLWFITWDDDELTITKNASRELKELTNSNKISIVLLHHFNKWNSQERALPRWLSSIRSSWKLENDADYVFQVWRDLSEWWDNTTTILLQKDRVWGTPNSIDILFDRWDYIDK